MKLRGGWCFAAFIFILVLAAKAFTLDREAFTLTDYDLNVRVEPEQQRLGARGKITLRNVSSTAQKIAVLQISSSLDWRSITSGGGPVQFVSQPFTSDIDHTGKLSEAVVTLPTAVAPGASVELEIGYEGVIVPDATRLTRIATPEQTARNSDWDEIGPKFTAVRGAGYVAWYPIATEAENLSDTEHPLEVLGRWKAREETARVHLQIQVDRDDGESQRLIVNNSSCRLTNEQMGRAVRDAADCTYEPLGYVVPTFATAAYALLERPNLDIFFSAGHRAAATAYADTADNALPFISDWFGAPKAKSQAADLPEADAAPFASGSLLLAPLLAMNPKTAGLIAAYQCAHAAFFSSRPWMNEGLAHFAQAIYLEHQHGRQAAIDYMAAHRSALEAFEQQTAANPAIEANRSLINTTDEDLSRSKAMYVWWMLRDILGEPALKKTFSAYHADRDKEPSYMPHLIQSQAQRDLEWFFDDWVYRDRGLPDFKVESAFSRKTMNEAFIVTVTVVNLGRAGAEVPVIVKFPGGEVMKRVEVRGNSKGILRVEISKAPEEVVVNDGSVPESDTTNNRYKIVAATPTSWQRFPLRP